MSADASRERTVTAFRSSWAFVRGLTVSFIEATPDERWEFTPHLRYGSMARQFRHVAQVTDLYGAVVRTGRLDMAAKFARCDGSLVRGDLLASRVHHT